MYKALHDNILKRIKISEEDFAQCISFFKAAKIKRKQFLLREGEICKYTCFVSKGCLRSYSTDEKGNEHVIQFAIEDWWISDLYSFLTAEPATYNIDALEDSEVLLIEKNSQEDLCAQIPAFERFFRLLLQNNYIANHRRITAALSATAEKRYLTMLATYPHLVERLPQHQIASYLGITPESLSRIRKTLLQKNK
ncbi:Crp/Fnr family transcriptional regulator [candidate division KSB1 bacterium]|nr:Crp/Fnr family transcriptional regulator [candidate division KSB1 bacterium]